MDSKSFKFIFFLIENHHIFFNQSTYPQALLKSQLKFAFYKLANDEIASGFVPLITQWRVFEGHIDNYI